MDAIIVPCTQEKVWDDNATPDPTPAKDAYTHRAFADWRRFAEQSGNPWFILSTQYGLLRPDDPISPYNVPVSSARADPSFKLRLREQGKAMLDQFDRVVLLDWERFQPLVRAAVRADMPCVLHRLEY